MLRVSFTWQNFYSVQMSGQVHFCIPAYLLWWRCKERPLHAPGVSLWGPPSCLSDDSCPWTLWRRCPLPVCPVLCRTLSCQTLSLTEITNSLTMAERCGNCCKLKKIKKKKRKKQKMTATKHIIKMKVSVSVSVFCSRWHRSDQKGPYMLYPISQQSPQGCPPNSANVCVAEQRSFRTSECGILIHFGAWSLGHFVSPLLFPSGDQCCSNLACWCSVSSSSL